MRSIGIFFIVAIIGTTACSTATKERISRPDPVRQNTLAKQPESQKALKRKVAIGRFSNETRRGNSFLFDENSDRVGKQASDILAARLAATEKFLLLERSDLGKLTAENELQKINSNLVGADYLIIGSVSALGRSDSSEVGIFSRNKKQVATATVNVRLVDVATGQIVFSQEGSGASASEANTVFGVGAKAGYDAALDDQALSASISKLVNNLVENLMEKSWTSFILDFQDGNLIMSGGKSQGIKVGDSFRVMQRGRKIKNPQSGMLIELPRKEVAKVKVLSFSGTGNDEVSICVVSDGSLKDQNTGELVIQEL